MWKSKFNALIYATIGSLNFVRRIEWKKIFKYLDQKKNEKILDIACGNGVLSYKIAKRGCIVHGIDFSKRMVIIAKKFSNQTGENCSFYVGNAEFLPYRDAYFDKIVCSSSLEHFYNDTNALKEMKRVLKPDGCIILTVDSFTYPINNDLKKKHKQKFSVVNYYTCESLKERLITAGLIVTKWEYIFNSKLTSLFYNYLIIEWSEENFFWAVISILVHPLCGLSDKISGNPYKGYTLIVKARILIRR